MTTNLTQNRSPDAGDANHLSRVSAVWWLAATLIAGATTVINFWRVKDINPVILQDEWVYSMTSRKTDSWDQAPLLDFGNYLFNIVYSWTSICGPGFYTCAKALNHVFLFGFALALFYVVSVLSRPGFGLSVVPLVTLGPVAIYGSLFLPESLFFFLVATTLVFLVRFFSSLERSDLLVAGFLGALASLTKPHGLISVGLFSLAVFLVVTNRSSLFRGSISAVIFGGTAVAGKSLLGFFIAGPKGLNPLAGYRIGNSGFLTGDDLQNRAPGLIERFPGIAAELPNQLTIQFTSLLVLLSAAFAVTALGAFGFGMKNQVLERSFATLTLIWSTGLVLVFSIFGAYLTAGGADHSTRALMRYYDFVLPVLAASSVVVARTWFAKRAQPKFGARLPIAGGSFLVATWGAQSLVTGLEVQIADAPHLAGFVSSNLAGMAVSVSAMLLCGLLIFQPRLLVAAIVPLSIFSFIALGDATARVYSVSRLQDSAADNAGKSSLSELGNSDLIISHSRFDARVLSFWKDSFADFAIQPKGATVNLKTALGEYEEVWLTGQLLPDIDSPIPVEHGDGYLVFNRGELDGSIHSYVDPSLQNVNRLVGFSLISTEGHMLVGRTGKLILSEQLDGVTIQVTLESDRGLSGYVVNVNCGAASGSMVLPPERAQTSLVLGGLKSCQTVSLKVDGPPDISPSLEVGTRLRVRALEVLD